jgi:hypothetical protein
MWADTLLAAERHHFLRAAIWGCSSLALGGGLIIVLAVKRHRSPLLTHFALQMAVWGGGVAALSVVRWRLVTLRDVTGATRLDRMVWFSTGLDLGIAGIGLAIAVACWLSGRRLGGLGAGVAIATQGLALMILDLQLIAAISR